MGSVFGGRPTVVGHRGSGRTREGGLAENTRESLLAGVESGLRWVEFDVRRTADDHLVIRHFPTWEDGSFIAHVDLSGARKVGAVTLDELLEDLPGHVGVNLDVKTSLEDAVRPPGRTTAAILAPVAAELSRERPVLVSAFDASAMLQLAEAAPEVPRSYLTWVTFPLRMAIPAAKHLGAAVVAPHWTSFGPNRDDRAPVFAGPTEAIALAHEAGLEVMPWCPHVEHARELLGAGADAVVVDDVGLALRELSGVAD
ncbi:MAG TPA: glycerophosphodiester phosphodiesterase [Segeticoccus sp.]|jgi:glycerophosphoryl diester phosphodiesterase|nr:glycerophosphodiester phosphodiesterase [Segeticoccus sp.]